MTYVTNLFDIYASATYLAITCEVLIVVCCALAYTCKNIESTWPSRILPL